jgi:ATP-binding cassette subfamily F protein 3
MLDEPTNHLDIDSKDVLLEALEDFGGTLIFVSHDRYFVDRLATKIVEIGGGDAVLYPGNYEEYHWKKTHQGEPVPESVAHSAAHPPARPRPAAREQARRADQDRRASEAERRRRQRAADARRRRVEDLEARIGEREQAIKTLEAQMAAPGFYDDHAAARAVVDRHQALMWEVGDLMNQWEALQTADVKSPLPEGS